MIPYAKLIIFGVVLAAGVAAGASIHKVFSDRTIAQLEAKYATDMGKIEKARADAEANTRRIETQAAQAAEQVRSTHATQLARATSREAALRADGNRLRANLAAFAAGPAADDSLAACRERSATLGHVLGQGDELAQELASAAERHADEVRILKLHNDEVLKFFRADFVPPTN